MKIFARVYCIFKGFQHINISTNTEVPMGLIMPHPVKIIQCIKNLHKCFISSMYAKETQEGGVEINTWEQAI
jgi:hypothetical protein